MVDYNNRIVIPRYLCFFLITTTCCNNNSELHEIFVWNPNRTLKWFISMLTIYIGHIVCLVANNLLWHYHVGTDVAKEFYHE